ncbi:hypothetical protein dsx2_1092 [Desulfovibrio sp. X2]|nr:hypothetical protein dsx2_1092 [Desulfovibrio sp. X2]
MEYILDQDGIHQPMTPVRHRDEEYEESGFALLLAMQERHFWYRGRHRFLLRALDGHLAGTRTMPEAIDLGGGVGGWLRYLATRRPGRFGSLALADSSLLALRMAGDVLPAGTERYRVDLMDLGWRERWDVAFLLDVIEHLPDDAGALREAGRSLRPGGLLFVTAPAMPRFWSYNDEYARHLRRYVRQDLAHLAEQAGLELHDARYFMFLLSPLYWLSRHRPGIDALDERQRQELARRSHQVPAWPINEALAAVFGAETPLGHRIRFPWGTSILGVFRKP